MCRIMEEAFKEVTREKALQIARRMFLEGITVDMIARCTGLPIEDVEALREELLIHA